MSEPSAVDIGDSWKPAALREAEAALDETMAKSRRLIQQVEEKLRQLPDLDHTAKPEDITAIKKAAERPDAPAPLRELKKKVEAGELTWQAVLEGKALGDPAVRQLMAARLDQMREIYQEVEAGATLDDILEARGVTGGSVLTDPPGPSGYTHTPARPGPSATSDEDAFEDPLASAREPDLRAEPREPERREPEPRQPPRRPRDRARPSPQDETDDDDYFAGGSFLN